MINFILQDLNQTLKKNKLLNYIIKAKKNIILYKAI